MRRAQIVGIVAAVAAGVTVAALALREPQYHGRGLSSWLRQCSETPLMEKARLAEAQEAVRAIGAKRALPELMRLAEARDHPAREWIAAKCEGIGIRFLHERSADERQLEAIAGFEALGTNGAPSVGELTKALGDGRLAFVAVRCLDNIGKPAEAALCQGLTNRDAAVRRWSVAAVAGVTDDVEVYLNRIKGRLNDSDENVRYAAVSGVAAQKDAAELALPLLVSTLADRNDGVACEAARSLADFGNDATNAFAALTNFVNTSNENRVSAGFSTLEKIAPEKSLLIFSNAVVNGSGRMMLSGLAALKATAPELGLRMTLEALKSDHGGRCAQGLIAARSYDIETPGIVDAIKAVWRPEANSEAIRTMNFLVQRQKAKVGSVLNLPNDPSYQGKTLGEWLETHAPDSEATMSSNALAAVRAMGTNAIPSLLQRMEYRDPVFGLFDYEASTKALLGFCALGERAAPALPDLAERMNGDDGEAALRAVVATECVGADAGPWLQRALTNKYPDVRAAATDRLRDMNLLPVKK